MEQLQWVKQNGTDRMNPLTKNAQTIPNKSMEVNYPVAIIGDNPEALLLSVLYAEAGIHNFLVGPFGEDSRTHANRPGIEEALWLLGIFKRSGKIKVIPDYHRLPLSQISTLIFADHVSSPEHTNAFERTIRAIAPEITSGTTVVFAGLCRLHYTSSVVKSTIESQGGLKVGVDTNLYYLPLFWAGERVREFKERPKVLAGFESTLPTKFQEELLQVFPSLSLTSTVELAEASGLYSAISREVSTALELELAKMSEMHGINYDEVLELCRNNSILLHGRTSIPHRESIGTGIALSSSHRKNIPRIVRAAHTINGEYQTQIVDMIRRALGQCGQSFRRSRVAILGTDGLLKNSWSKPESPPIIGTLRRKGARITLYPGEKGSQPWVDMLGQDALVENSLLKAVAKADCAIVALPKSSTLELDPDQLAMEMNRPGAICDLTRVMEASNVEKAGLFYTTIGRGTFDT